MKMLWRATSFSGSLKRDQHGSVAVEFALVAPVLVFVLAGVVDIGSATYSKLSQDAQVTTVAEYALLLTAPGDQAAAETMAEALIGLLQGSASGTAEVVVNNAASAVWTGSAVTTSPLPGNAGACYCPTLSQGGVTWGSSAACGTTCATGGSAGQFIQITSTARHISIFPSYAFIDGDEIAARTMLKLQ